MYSTFHGLETSKRGILTQSVALNTVGHNISNASTQGYTRQRVNMSAAEAVYVPGYTRLNTPGQLGTGVQYDSITRVRDSYLDMQFRRETQELGKNSVLNATFDSLQSIINEPSTTGVNAVMNSFWNSLEVLNRDPNLLSARVDFIGKAQNMADTFNKIGTSLSTLEQDVNSNIAIKLTHANNIIADIAKMNDTIRRVEILGDNANDYRDTRDLLMDELSKIIDVTYTEDANGMVSIFSGGVNVVNGVQTTALTAAEAPNITSGEIKGYAQSLIEIDKVRNQLNAMVNTLVNGTVDVTMPNGYKTQSDMVAKNDVTVLDEATNTETTIVAGDQIPAGSKIVSAVTFEVQGFNGLHKLGYALDGTTGLEFFSAKDASTTFTIDNIIVNPVIKNDTNKVAASGQYTGDFTDPNFTPNAIKGNSDIALTLAGMRDIKFTYPSALTSMTEGTTDDYFRAFVSELGTSASVAKNNYKTSMDLQDNVEVRRQATSGVSIDEELTDLIRFQHAYNAAARNMTTIDEMLDRIINNMGLVGR